MSSSDRKPATYAFNRGLKSLPLFVLLGAVIAFVLSGASFSLLALLILFVILYSLVFVGGARIVRLAGLKLLKRDH